MCIIVSKMNKFVPTSDGSDVVSVGLGLGMVVLRDVLVSLSSKIGSMTSLMLPAGLLVGEGVGESGMMIGLVGEFGGVDSRDEGISRMSWMVRGM